MQGIEIQGLVKRYPKSTDLLQFLRRPWARDEVPALRGLDVRLEPGRIYGLVGPNGAGKTTLMKIVAGLVLPTEGVVRIDGEDLSRRPRRLREKVGLVVADERSFYWRLTLRQNLSFFATLQKLDGRERDRRVLECLELVGLAQMSERVFRELSTGMRQRLSIARGLLAAAPILLLDEPTRSLDPLAARGVRELVRELVASDPTRIVVYSSHHLAEVSDLCSSILVLRDGRLVADRDGSAGGGAARRAFRIRTRGEIPEEALSGLGDVEILHRAPTEISLSVARAELIDVVIDRLRLHEVGIESLQPDQVALEDLLGAGSQEPA